MSQDLFCLKLTKDYQGRHVLWFVRTEATRYQHVDYGILFGSKHRWLEWVETFELKGKAQREMGVKDWRNIMVFSELSDAIMIKLAFQSSMFETK